MLFYSDNTAPASPEILAAMTEANNGAAEPYGDDRWTARLDEVLGAFFGTQLRAFVVTTGTAANALGLASVTPPYGGIFSHQEAHVYRDECGAPQLFSGGAQMLPVDGSGAKLTTESLADALNDMPPSVHSVRPAAISLTQATELGTVYRPDEICALSSLARRHHLKVHMDGARLANAIAFLNCDPSETTWRVGVDVLSFGATKNGALAAEAVVFFDSALARDFELRRKRVGHLVSKSRYVAAQLLAYIESGVWRKNALRANALARRIAAAAGSTVLYPVESNQVFLHLSNAGKRRLRGQGFGFYDWGRADSGHARFVVSWDQPEQDITALCDALLRD